MKEVIKKPHNYLGKSIPDSWFCKHQGPEAGAPCFDWGAARLPMCLSRVRGRRQWELGSEEYLGQGWGTSHRVTEAAVYTLYVKWEAISGF